MSSRRRLKRENPLLRRVRRHANTSTLFRMRGSDSVPPALEPVQQATRTLAQSAQPAAPSSESIAAAVARAEMFTGNVQGQQSARLPAQQPAPVAQQTAQPTQQKGQPAQQTAPATPQPAAQDDPNDSIPWRRLSRIAEMHRQRKAGAGQLTADGGRQTVDGYQSSGDSNQLSAVSGQSSTLSEAPSQPQQQVPLEAAWPVQREPQAKPEPPAQRGRPEAAAQEPLQRTPEDKETEEQLRARLESVKAARSSDSSVELHLPRRPRPTLPGAGQQTEAPKQAQQQQQTPPVQRQPEQEPQTVPTEIGPLPADMWELLGQSPHTTKQTNEPTTQPTNRPSNNPGNSPAASIQRAIDAAEQKATPPPQPESGDTSTAVPQLPQRPPQQTSESDQLSVDSEWQTTDGGRQTVDSNQLSVNSDQSSAVSGQRSALRETPSQSQKQAADPQSPGNEAPEASLPRQSSTVNEPRAGVAPESAPQLQRQETSQPASKPTSTTDEPHAAQPDEPTPQPPQPAPASEEAIARAIAAAEQPAAPEPPSRQQPAEQPQKTGQRPQPDSPSSDPEATQSSQTVQRTSQPEVAPQAPPAGNWEHSAATEPQAATTQTPTPETPASPTSKQQLSAPQEASLVQRAPKAPATPETPAPRVQTDVARRSAAEAGHKSRETADTPPAPPVAPAPNAEQHFGSEPAPQSDENGLIDAPTAQRATQQASESAPTTPDSPAIQQQSEDGAPLTPEAADDEAIARAIAAAEAPPSPDTPPASARPEARPGGPPASLPATGDHPGRGPAKTAQTRPTPPAQTPSQKVVQTTRQPAEHQPHPAVRTQPHQPQTSSTTPAQADTTTAPNAQQQTSLSRWPSDQPTNHPTTQPSNPIIARLLTEPEAPALPPADSASPQHPVQPLAQDTTNHPGAPITSAIERAIAAAEQPGRRQAATVTTPPRTLSGQPTTRPANHPTTQPYSSVTARAVTPAVPAPAPQARVIRRQAESYPQGQPFAESSTPAFGEQPAWTSAPVQPAPEPAASDPAQTTPLTATAPTVQRVLEHELPFADEPAIQPAIQPTIHPTNEGAKAPTTNQSPISDQSLSNASASSSAPASRQLRQKSDIQRAIAAAERSTPRPLAPEAPANEALVQRAQETMDDEQEDDDWNLPQLFSGPDDATPQVQENKQENEESEEPQIDIEELAQRVYNDLRRRLTVDWERERGRR